MQSEQESRRWALCQWNELHPVEHIHRDDLDRVRELRISGVVHRVIGEEDGFIILRYDNVEFRVHPSQVKPLDVTAREVGDAVILKDGRIAEVLCVIWHDNEGQPFYFLRVEGKKKSKRYWEWDFKRRS